MLLPERPIKTTKRVRSSWRLARVTFRLIRFSCYLVTLNQRGFMSCAARAPILGLLPVTLGVLLAQQRML